MPIDWAFYVYILIFCILSICYNNCLKVLLHQRNKILHHSLFKIFPHLNGSLI